MDQGLVDRTCECEQVPAGGGVIAGLGRFPVASFTADLGRVIRVSAGVVDHAAEIRVVRFLARGDGSRLAGMVITGELLVVSSWIAVLS